MNAQIHRSFGALEALQAEWRAAPATPFTCWEFAQFWYQEHAPQIEPFVVSLRDASGRLQAVAPWGLRRERLGSRVLIGLGGDDAWYQDPIWLGEEPKAALALADALRHCGQSWDMLRLNLRPCVSASLLEQLSQLGPCLHERVDWRQHPILVAEESWEATLRGRSHKFRGNLNRYRRRLSERPHRFVAADPGNAEDLLETLFNQHEQRHADGRDWRPYYRLVRVMVMRALARGELFLHGLEIQGEMAALELRLRHGDEAFCLMRSYLPEFHELAAGHLLTAWTFETLHAAGVRSMNLGPGQYDWKARWQTGVAESVQIFAASPRSLLGQGAVTLKRVVDACGKRPDPAEPLADAPALAGSASS